MKHDPASFPEPERQPNDVNPSHDDTPENMHAELSDEQLAGVAGGRSIKPRLQLS